MCVCMSSFPILLLRCNNNESKKIKNPNCMDRLLIHRDQEPSRPIWNWEKINTKVYLSFELLTTCYLVSSPNVERKTRSLTLDEVRSSRERMPEYCANSSIVGSVVEGFVPKKNRGQKVDIIGHFGEASIFAAPKWRGGGEAKIMCSL